MKFKVIHLLYQTNIISQFELINCLINSKAVNQLIGETLSRRKNEKVENVYSYTSLAHLSLLHSPKAAFKREESL